MRARSHEYFIATFQEATLLARGKFYRGRPAMRGFQQATASSVIRCGDGAGAEEIARSQFAAVTRMMRHHLRSGPIHVTRVAKIQSVRRKALLLKPRREQEHFERQINRARLLVYLVP